MFALYLNFSTQDSGQGLECSLSAKADPTASSQGKVPCTVHTPIAENLGSLGTQQYNIFSCMQCQLKMRFGEVKGF